MGRNIALSNNAVSPFYRMTRLTAITLSDKVTAMCNNQLYGCTGITTITSNATVPPVCPTADVFRDVNKTTTVVRVPYQTSDAYKVATGWELFANYEEFGEPIIPGDLDGEKIVSVNDLTQLVNIVMNGGAYSIAADLNGDHILTVADISLLVKLLLN